MRLSTFLIAVAVFAAPTTGWAGEGLTVSVLKPRSIFVGREVVSIEQLVGFVQERAPDRAATLTIFVDGEAPSDLVRSVYDALSTAGYSSIEFRTHGTWLLELLPLRGRQFARPPQRGRE
jgi:biopolymer transport protein ExbD